MLNIIFIIVGIMAEIKLYRLGAQVKWLSEQENNYRFKVTSLEKQLDDLKQQHQNTRQQLMNYKRIDAK